MKEISFEDKDDFHYTLKNYKRLNEEAIKILKENYGDYKIVLNLFEKVRNDENLIFKQLLTLKIFLINLYNSRNEFENHFDFESIKKIIIILNGNIIESRNIIKKEKSPKEIRRSQEERIRSLLKEEIIDDRLIDKYIGEIFSCNNPKDFEKITREEILAHFRIFKNF